MKRRDFLRTGAAAACLAATGGVVLADAKKSIPFDELPGSPFIHYSLHPGYIWQIGEKDLRNNPDAAWIETHVYDNFRCDDSGIEKALNHIGGFNAKDCRLGKAGTVRLSNIHWSRDEFMLVSPRGVHYGRNATNTCVVKGRDMLVVTHLFYRRPVHRIYWGSADYLSALPESPSSLYATALIHVL